MSFLYGIILSALFLQPFNTVTAGRQPSQLKSDLIDLPPRSTSASRTLTTTPPRGWAWYPPQTRVPHEVILANTTLLAKLSKIAIPDPTEETRGTIIFTTLRFGDGDLNETMEMINSFCYWLHEASLLRHTLLITTDEFTWEMVAAVGHHPIYLDRVFPRREEYIDAVRPEDTYNREFDVQKHWWGMRLVELGFRVIYMDSDNLVLRPNLLDPFDHPYDVQGLSDWFEPELWPVGGALNRSCGLYFMVADDRLPRGAVLREKWHFRPGEQGLDNTNPCQSTGLWYLQPTNTTISFMRAMVQRIAYDVIWQWDQTAWNEVILPFLWGAGDQNPLTYRLLPVSEYANVPVVVEREKAGLETDLMVLHAGGIHGADKKKSYIEREVYHPDFKTPSDYLIMQYAVPEVPPEKGTAAAASIFTGTGVHHWQPPDENAFWTLLWIILIVMALGATLVVGWQVRNRGKEKLEREWEAKVGPLKRTTSSDRRRRGG